jgi:2-polyprenyl-6-methoxyphenol hydroxylase-like FAD-dependent oxidoreductase
MTKTNDVLIVGAGPVGLLTALSLAQEGIQVTVIEAEPAIVNEPRAPVYFPSTIAAIDRLGMLEDFKKVASIGTSFAQHFPAFDEVIRLQTSALEGITYPFNLHCGQDRLAELAGEYAQKLGVQVLYGHRLLGLAEDADGVTATLETPAEIKTLRAQWVIGCDGARSTVRKLMALPYEGYTWPDRFIATNVIADLHQAGYADANFVIDPVEHAVIVLIDRARKLWRIAMSEPTELDVKDLASRLPARLDGFAKGVPWSLSAFRPYVLHQRCTPKFRVGRLLLAGDSAHATSPIGGLGLSNGIWDGMVLSDVLAAVIKKQLGEDALDRYSEERFRVYWEVVGPGAKENKRFLQEQDQAQRERDLGFAKSLPSHPEIALMTQLFGFKLIGDLINPNSKWRGLDPTPTAGIDLRQRTSQVGNSQPS